MIWLACALLLTLAFLHWRYAWWLPAVDEHAPRILMYHMVSEHRPGAKFNKLRVPPSQFEQQLRWLQNRGWTFMTLQELFAAGGQHPRKTVVLTFDDGYADNFTNAWRLMRQYNANGTLYLVVDRHDRDWSTYKKAHHDSGELAREPKLSDAQVQTMLDSGLIELGGHTWTHANLARLDTAAREHEIAASRVALQAQFGVNVDSFAYPFGIYTPADPPAVAAAGYQHAVTTQEGIDIDWQNRPYELRRIKVSGKDSLFSFALKMRRGIRGVRS